MKGRDAAERWIRGHLDSAHAIELTRERPWSTVLRVRHLRGTAWFKACGAVQQFEPRLSAQLFHRWPDRVGEVLGHDEARAWLLLADAGVALRELGNPPEAWLEVLPLYAELQRGEAANAEDHLTHGVPSLPVATLPARYAQLLELDLPLTGDELGRLKRFLPLFELLCPELASDGLPHTIQHDDLHMASVYVRDGEFRILDWGDSSVSHPFFSLVETFRFLEERTGLVPHDPWFPKLRDAYLEPWGRGAGETFALAMRVGRFAHAIAWARHREFLRPSERRPFDEWFGHVLRRAMDVGAD